MLGQRSRTVGVMLEARRVSLWRNRYEIVADGQPLAMWDGRVWRNGGTFDLAGRRYDVKSKRVGHAIRDDRRGRHDRRDGRSGRSQAVDGGGERPNIPFPASVMVAIRGVTRCRWPAGGLRSGASRWRRDAVADLPDLPLPLQVFVVVVVLTMWDAQATAAATAGG